MTEGMNEMRAENMSVMAELMQNPEFEGFKETLESDKFLEMPPMAQLLYIHLWINQDSEHLIRNAKATTRGIGGSADDLRTLLQNGFLVWIDPQVYYVNDLFLSTLEKENKNG